LAAGSFLGPAEWIFCGTTILGGAIGTGVEGVSWSRASGIQSQLYQLESECSTYQDDILNMGAYIQRKFVDICIKNYPTNSPNQDTSMMLADGAKISTYELRSADIKLTSGLLGNFSVDMTLMSTLRDQQLGAWSTIAIFAILGSTLSFISWRYWARQQPAIVFEGVDQTRLLVA